MTINIFEALRESHALQRSLSRQVLDTSGDTPERQALFKDLREELAAHALAEDRQRCLEAGMNDYVRKPVEPNQLYATVLRWLPAPVAAAVPVMPAEAPPVPAVPTQAALMGIAGLEVEMGLKAVAGHWDRYARLLDLFAREHGGDAAALRAHLAALDHPRDLTDLSNYWTLGQAAQD